MNCGVCGVEGGDGVGVVVGGGIGVRVGVRVAVDVAVGVGGVRTVTDCVLLHSPLPHPLCPRTR